MMKVPPRRLILIGPRGSGKSTLGRLAAARLGWPLLDLDEEVTRAAGRSIADIFATEGETGFREREGQELRRALENEPLVLATGGGVILRAEHREYLRGAGWVVWLNAAPSLLATRIGNDPATQANRPSLSGRPAVEELCDQVRDREPLYRSTADIEFSTERESPNNLILRLMDQLPWTCTT